MLERRRIRVQYQALYLIQSLIHVAVPQVPLDGLQVCELIAVRRHQLNRPLKLPGPGNRRSRASGWERAIATTPMSAQTMTEKVRVFIVTS